MILGIRTDSPVTELYLLGSDKEEVGRNIWESGRSLSVQLHQHIEDLLADHGGYEALQGVVVYEGPGSFTGLRIGITVANTLAYGLEIPVASGSGEEWVDDALKQLPHRTPGIGVLPRYGGEANITKPRK